MNQVSCPACHAFINIPAGVAAGQAMQCPFCQAVVSVPQSVANSPPGSSPLGSSPTVPTSSPAVPNVPMGGPSVGGAPVVPTGSSPSISTGQTPMVPMNAPAVPTTPQVPVPQVPTSPVPSQFAPTPVAPTPVTPVTPATPTPTSPPGVSPAKPGVPVDVMNARVDEPTVNSSWLMLGLMIGIGGLIVAGLLVFVLLLRSSKRDEKVDAGSQIAIPTSGAKSGSPTSRSSADVNLADKNSKVLNQVTVAVKYVDYDEVRAKDKNNQVRKSDGKKYLKIFLNIRNSRLTALNYTSWYGSTFGTAVAKLTDSKGGKYDMLTFTDVVSVEGNKAKAKIASKESIDDVVIFEVSEKAVKTRSFRLSLPSEAFGQSGTYRFVIPRDKINL